MSPSPIDQHHAEWLKLVEYSGPFLTQPVLKRALPQGLEPTDPPKVEELRRAYKEWEEDPELYGQWIRWVLRELLALEDPVLLEGPKIPTGLAVAVPEHGATLRPDLAVIEPDDPAKARLLVMTWPHGIPLDKKLPGERWAATPLDRLTELLKGAGVRLGLATDGERWTLAHVPASGAPAYAFWDAGIWLEERITLDAFITLLSSGRFFAAAESDTLEALFTESASAEQEVTDQLGKQVKEAVELLVAAFSRANRERGGKLLDGISDHEIYLAAVTVMMRLVFLLSAEERGLFLLGDSLYDESYAVSTLLSQLERQAEYHGEEPLQYRSAAWHRVLGTFRLVHEGVQHENLRLPPYGGSLFDPSRFPFLEGRAATDPLDASRPLPVDDRTMLHILDAIQVLRFRRDRRVTEARRLTFAALDVEQIGHVYEGLLDHDAVWVTAPAVGIEGKLEPEVSLQEMEEKLAKGRSPFVAWLTELADRTPNSVERALDEEFDANARARLLAACENDRELAERITPFLGLLREDLRGLPVVFLPESVYVTRTSERRSSGTYYTPRSLAEEVVEHALSPLVYDPGPAEHKNPEKWVLKPPAAILDLKVCDMAMGSGAFLVAACRYLSDRLIEAWERVDDEGPITPTGHPASGTDLTVPDDPEDRALLARRLVADRCLYGVDKNPMAVEMAKLSMWLITLARDRPFSFLDHALKSGDSLLGVKSLDQIEHFHMDPARGKSLYETFEVNWDLLRSAVKNAVERRRELESFPVITLRDAEAKRQLEREAMVEVEALRVVGDVLLGAALSTARSDGLALDGRLVSVTADVGAALDIDRKEADRIVRLQELKDKAIYWLDEGNPDSRQARRPFHWPVEFPEIFDEGGFHAFVGNPPFLGGKRVSGALGTDMREWLMRYLSRGKRGNADLVSFFFLRGFDLLRSGGDLSLLGTNTVAQGDTREVGLLTLEEQGADFYRAWKSRPWPGDASVQVAVVWLRRGTWEGLRILDGEVVPRMTSLLDPVGRVTGEAQTLRATSGRAFKGSNLNGIGFVISPEEARLLLESDANNRDVLFPYLNGKDLNTQPDQMGTRWVISFFDWDLGRAQQYPDCLRIVRERVKPHRDSLPDYKRRVRDHWWQYEYVARSLYQAIERQSRALSIAVVSKVGIPVTAPTGQVFTQDVVVFPGDDPGQMGALTSTFHWWWAVTRASTMRTDLRYTPTDCFETFPQPELTDDVAHLAQALDEHRRAMMLDHNEGLTKTYNRVHNSGSSDSDVVELRGLHVDLDQSVATAYGWSDLVLDHDFYQTPQGLRYTLGPQVRVEVLDRLLELNHERHSEEVVAALPGSKTGGKKRRAKAGQTSLIDG